jgi:hypothetical protein
MVSSTQHFTRVGEKKRTKEQQEMKPGIDVRSSYILIFASRQTERELEEGLNC